MLRAFAAWIVIFVLTACALDAIAQGKAKGRGDQPKNTTPAPSAAAKSSGNAFGTDEIRIIREWFSNPTI